jgi:hypothetical protein
LNFIGRTPRLEAACFYPSGFKGKMQWGHTVVLLDGVRYDSRGIFSEDALRISERWHPRFKPLLDYSRERREYLVEDEDVELHEFYLSKLKASFLPLRDVKLDLSTLESVESDSELPAFR